MPLMLETLGALKCKSDVYLAYFDADTTPA